MKIAGEPRWKNSKQSIYTLVDRLNVKKSWRRTRGTEIASSNKSDGLQIQLVVKNGKDYVIPVEITAEQVDGEILVNVNGQLCYRGKIKSDEEL